MLNPSGDIKPLKCVLYSNFYSGQVHTSAMIWDELDRDLQRPTLGTQLD